MTLNRLLFERACALSLVPCAILFFSLFATTTFAQQKTIQVSEQEQAYNRTIQQRAEKIVSAIQLNDEAKAARVSKRVAQQYHDLNDIYAARDEKLKSIKGNNADGKDQSKEINEVQEEVKKQLLVLHNQYLESLAKELTPEQIDQVKDGMTYNVVHVTYKAYQDMIPTLTEDQKKQIMVWLIEAREFAMDAESSDKKHAWFGKYKGRINNYLAAAGYDLKKAGDDWQKRIAAEKAAKKSS